MTPEATAFKSGLFALRGPSRGCGGDGEGEALEGGWWQGGAGLASLDEAGLCGSYR